VTTPLPTPLLDRLDRAPCELDPLLPAEQLQQHKHAFVRAQGAEQTNLLTTRTRVPGTSPRGFGNSTKPLRSRDLISLMTASGTRAGCSPSITRRRTPADHRAFHQPETINRKQ